MTSDRHLALMALMREIEEPTRTYQRSIRLAAALSSNTPQWDTAVNKGNTALDEIETAVRRWTAEHPEPSTLPAGFERKTCVTVACTACGYPYDEAEFTMHFPSAGEAVNHVVSDGWDELKDGRVLCMRDDEQHNELRDTVGVNDPDDDTEQAEGQR